MRLWILAVLAVGWFAVSCGSSACAEPVDCGEPVAYAMPLPRDPLTWRLGEPHPLRTAEPPEAKRWRLRDGVVERHDGAGWRAEKLPEVPAPEKVPRGLITGLAVAGPREVWAVGDVTTHRCCDLWAHHREVVMRWDGAAWHLLDLGIRGLRIDAAAVDGHGGLWVAGGDVENHVAVLLHHDQGKWTHSPLPLPGGDTGAEALTFKRDRLTAIGYPSSRTLTWGPPG